MALLLHAITSRTELAAPCEGLRGGQLVHVNESNLTAWATALPHESDPFTRDDLLEHHKLVSHLFAGVDACLPARFPTWMEDVLTLEDHLRQRVDALTRQLVAVRGCCEVAVTALWTSPDEEIASEGETTPGRRYLEERRLALAGSDRRRAAAVELADDIELRAGEDLVRAVRQVCPSAYVALSDALLVTRSAASEVSQRLRTSHDGVRILVNGPWPPYTFATIRSD